MSSPTIAALVGWIITITPEDGTCEVERVGDIFGSINVVVAALIEVFDVEAGIRDVFLRLEVDLVAMIVAVDAVEV